MARIDFSLDRTDAANGAAFVDADLLFDLGMQAACGRNGPVDCVAAHMYFNLADMKGAENAAHHRQEMAALLSKRDVAKAQRAAREWLTRH